MRGRLTSAVPTFILGERVWVGFTLPVVKEIEAAVGSRIRDGPLRPPTPTGDLNWLRERLNRERGRFHHQVAVRDGRLVLRW